MILKILQINIENDKHLDKIINLVKEKDPDIVCMQEVVVDSWVYVLENMGYSFCFAPMLVLDGKEEGVLIFSKYKILKNKVFRYDLNKGNTLPVFNKKDLALIDGVRPWCRFLYHFVLLNTSLEINNIVFNVVTTHFPVADHVVPDLPFHMFKDNQNLIDLLCIRNHFDLFIQNLSKIKKPLIFTADLNTPRGSFIYDDLAHLLVDWVPQNLNTTLDSKNHRVKELNLVVDTIMTSQDFDLINFEVIEGVSDHKALLATLEIC